MGVLIKKGKLGYSLVAVCRLLIMVTSLVADHGLQGTWLRQLQYSDSLVVVPRLSSIGSIVAAHGLNCSAACGILLAQELNLCLLHWQANSYPLSHQGSPSPIFLITSTQSIASLILSWGGEERQRIYNGLSATDSVLTKEQSFSKFS